MFLVGGSFGSKPIPNPLDAGVDNVGFGTGGVGGSWSSSDGNDIGIRMHYYGSGADQNAALVLAQDTGYLEWYSRGTDTANVFTGTVYGTIKTGAVILTNSTVTTSTTSGALQVAGGVGRQGRDHAVHCR